MKLKLLIQFILFLASGSLFAQNELSGKIKNAKDSAPLAGASVYISDLKLGAITDAEGNYVFHNAPGGSYLIEVSHVGYASQTRDVTVSNATTENFELVESQMQLKEVIVTGFASATEKQSSPVPVSVVNQKDFLQNT